RRRVAGNSLVLSDLGAIVGAICLPHIRLLRKESYHLFRFVARHGAGLSGGSSRRLPPPGTYGPAIPASDFKAFATVAGSNISAPSVIIAQPVISIHVLQSCKSNTHAATMAAPGIAKTIPSRLESFNRHSPFCVCDSRPSTVPHVQPLTASRFR